MTRQIHLAAYLPGGYAVAESARTAERAELDFVLLAPTVLADLQDLAAVTDRPGVAGAIDATAAGPSEVARQFAGLDRLCACRAARLLRTEVELPDAFVVDQDTGVYFEDGRIGAFTSCSAMRRTASSCFRTTGRAISGRSPTG
jgi:hypothetical protein